MDYRHPQTMLSFYKNHSKAQFGLAQSDPLSINDMTHILKERLLPKFDLARVITINSNSKKSEVYKRVSEAALINELKFREMEKAEGRIPFRIRLYDSMSMFTGHALLVYELVKKIQVENIPLSKAIRIIDTMRDEVYGYLISNDLSYMLNVRPIVQLHPGATKKIGTGKGFLGAREKLFEHVRKQIKQGLTSDVIAMSYG